MPSRQPAKASSHRVHMPAFDPLATFTVARPFKCSGQEQVKGRPFNKKLVSARRLRQLYHKRLLDQGSRPAGAPPPKPHTMMPRLEDTIAAHPNVLAKLTEWPARKPNGAGAAVAFDNRQDGVVLAAPDNPAEPIGEPEPSPAAPLSSLPTEVIVEETASGGTLGPSGRPLYSLVDMTITPIASGPGYSPTAVPQPAPQPPQEVADSLGQEEKAARAQALGDARQREKEQSKGKGGNKKRGK